MAEETSVWGNCPEKDVWVNALHYTPFVRPFLVCITTTNPAIEPQLLTLLRYIILIGHVLSTVWDYYCDATAYTGPML